jgi:hypothetical protein
MKVVDFRDGQSTTTCNYRERNVLRFREHRPGDLPAVIKTLLAINNSLL